MNNTAELPLLPMMEFSLNNWPCYFSIASPLKYFSYVIAVFLSEKELFSWTYFLKKTTQKTKILIFPVWNKILKIRDTLFELIQIEPQCSKNIFKNFLLHEARAFGKIHKKGTANTTPKIEKYVNYIFTENICSSCNPMQVVVFCKNVLILHSNSNFLTLKVAKYLEVIYI